MTPRLTPAQAEEHLLALELFGMRFGLDRMRRLLTALGSPQERFEAVHVVGTNGKSSTTRMTAAILGEHGVAAGAYLSPHLVHFWERILIGGRELEPGAFAAALGRAAGAAAEVERTLEDGERVTQFELLTAAAFDELARRGAGAVVVEAGLGGRWDATNVIPSRVTVLTNVGLEHTRWLGPTVTDIAAEKLAVLRPGTTLVAGELEPEVLAAARTAAADLGARLVLAAEDPSPLPPLAAAGGFQRANFRLARAAARAFLGELDDEAVARAAAAAVVPGRLERTGEDPPTFVDGAHNPAGAAALAASLPEIAAGGPLVACVAVLDDKDAAAMLRALLPALDELVLTQTSNPRSLPAATLQSLAVGLGFAPADTAVEPDPHKALSVARDRARRRGGSVLATGSIYLVADLRAAPGERAASRL